MLRQKSFAPREEGSGTLYLVATPIENLEDMTVRVINTLKKADVIAAEDTRQTRKLTTYFNIDTPLVSYREHNRAKQGEVLVRRLLQGESVALVSDAGMPAVSDPGAELVRSAVREQNIPVVPVPGANAALTALVGSGLGTERFFIPRFSPPRAQKVCGRVAKVAADRGDRVVVRGSPPPVVDFAPYLRGVGQSPRGRRTGIDETP